jgi:hypothetical protein
MRRSMPDGYRQRPRYPRGRRVPDPVTRGSPTTGWRAETWLFLAWLALSVVALVLVFGLGAAGLGLVECQPSTNDVWSSPFGPCGDALATLGLALLVLLVGGIGLLVTGGLWVLTRPARLSCPECRAPVRRGDATCPTCGCDLRGAFDPPPV